MNCFNPLIDTVMQGADLNLQRVRQLVWLWQGTTHPITERIADDSIARMFRGEPVAEYDDLIAHAALVAVLPTIHDNSALKQVAPDNAKVLQIVMDSTGETRTSPFKHILTWSGYSTAVLADELGFERRHLRRLCEADYQYVRRDLAYIEALGVLGRWYANNAMPLGAIEDLLQASACVIAA